MVIKGSANKERGQNMSNQDILNTLSGLETAFYYRKDGSDSTEGVSDSKGHTPLDIQ